MEARTKNGEKSKKKHFDKHVLGNFTGAIQFKSGGRPSDKNKDGALVISSDSSDEDLEMVIATGNEERKRKHDLKEKITKTKKIGFKVGRKGKASTATEKNLQGDTEVNDKTASDNVDKSGKTLMELLELEMRARAIKALLGNKESGTTASDNAKTEVGNNELKVETEDEKGTNKQDDKEDSGDLSKEMEEEKRLQKAREQLHISEAKKREEEEATERNHAEIRKRLEEQQRMKEMDEIEAKQKEQEELEKAKKSQKKQEEYEKFLLWKQERQRKKEEKQRIELKRQEEDEWYTRQAVKQKERQMKESEIEQAKEKMRIDKMTEMKRSKINRINVAEDYSDEEFDTEENEDINVTDRPFPGANSISSSQGTEQEKQKLNECSAKRIKTRRYRRKNPDEEGQLPSDESEYASGPGDELGHDSFSDGRVSSGSETSLSNSEGSEKDDEEMDNRRIETIRRRRAEIRKRNRRRKPAADIEEGEVDSDGEHFEPMEESKDPKIRMILHHLPKRKRVKKVIQTDETESQNFDKDSSSQGMEEKENMEHMGESSIGDKEPPNEENILENNEVIANLIEEEAQTNISGKSNVTDHTENRIDNNSSVNVEQVDEKISGVGNYDKNDLNFDSKKIAPNDNPSVELKATNSQKIEIDKPTSDPILLEARRAFLSSKPKEENPKFVHPLRSSDSEGPSDNDNSLEETFEERAERKRKDKEERKRKKKVEEQRAKRFKRMQAFQARSGMQNFMDVDQPDSNDTEMIEEDESNTNAETLPQELESDKDITNPGTSTEKVGISEKPVNEESEIIDDQSSTSCGNVNQSDSISTQSKDDIVKDSMNTKGDVKSKRKRKGKEKKKSPEEAQMEGVGFWARMCESQGDFEVPNVVEEPTLPETTSVKDDNTTAENKTSYNPITTRKTRSGRYFPSRATNSKGRKLNVDKPNKEQVDKQQEEMDNVTWEDRWYQNKNVQKVMKHSQLMNKVRSNIKIKLKDPDSLAEQISTPESSGEINAGKVSSNSSSEITTPDNTQNETSDSGSLQKQITGSMEDYANIVGKTAQDLEKEQLEDLDKESDIDESDEDEGKDDDLWGEIMGAKS